MRTANLVGLSNQQRRERTLARLEAYPLKGAAKVIYEALAAELKGVENGQVG